MCTRFVYNGKETIVGFNFDIDLSEWEHTVIDKNAIAADFGAQCRNTYAGGYINFLDKTLGTVEEWEIPDDCGVCSLERSE